VLKNVGLICEACGAGRHYDCDLIKDPTKHMCLCSYTTHPYLTKEQLTAPTQRLISPIIPVSVGVEAQRRVVSTDLRAKDAAASARLRVSKD
jgi:hypothetical protein